MSGDKRIPVILSKEERWRWKGFKGFKKVTIGFRVLRQEDNKFLFAGSKANEMDFIMSSINYPDSNYFLTKSTEMQQAIQEIENQFPELEVTRIISVKPKGILQSSTETLIIKQD